jgi:hypothetical protein
LAVAAGFADPPVRLAAVAAGLSAVRASAGRAVPPPSGARIVVVVDVESRSIAVATDVESAKYTRMRIVLEDHR